jgi:hypothetical protein
MIYRIDMHTSNETVQIDASGKLPYWYDHVATDGETVFIALFDGQNIEITSLNPATLVPYRK